MNMKERFQNLKAWLYLLPAILFLGVFMVYPLIDVCVYSVEENYNFASQSFTADLQHNALILDLRQSISSPSSLSFPILI